jgi:hypothetical protein
MTLQHLDAVIAFAALMLGMSLLITVGTQLVVSLLGLRGANLRRGLMDLFETASADREARRYAKQISHRVLNHPLISDSLWSRFYLQVDKLPFVPSDAAAKLRGAASGIPFRPWLLGAVGGFFAWPIMLMICEYLFQDVCRYFDAVSSYLPLVDLCGHPWRSGAILGAVFAGLLSRWRLATSIGFEELVDTLEKCSAPPQGTLPDPVQRAMLVIAGEAHREPRLKAKAMSAPLESLDDDAVLGHGGGGVAVAVEKPVTQVAQVAAEEETWTEGLKIWFKHSMVRASQRFTVQARVIAVGLSLLVVFAAHLDAIRLLRTLTGDAQLRAEVAASADAIAKQAEQLPRTKESGRPVVPEAYRVAMAVVLQPLPAGNEPSRGKGRPGSRSAAPVAQPSQGSPLPSAGAGSDAPKTAQDSQNPFAIALASVQAASPADQAAENAPTRKAERKGKSAKSKAAAAEREKSAPLAPSREDRTTLEAKAIATKALEATPGFASREDAVAWLRATLDGNTAVENLTAAYDEEVNAQLVTEGDKLIDQSASVKRQLARSEFQLVPDQWPGWTPVKHELPGMLVAAMFLSLGAPFWFNTLKRVASLRPFLAIDGAKQNRH